MSQLLNNQAQGTALADGQRFYIPSLDGIRACAFALVFIAHNKLQGALPSGFGVTVFFFLSGYLITTLMRIEAESTGTVKFSSFYLRRVLRIFPPFYLVLAIGATLGLLGITPDVVHWKTLLLQALNVSNYAQIHDQYVPDAGYFTGSRVLWSLAVEEHFYLLFPLIYVILQKRFTRQGQAFWMLGLCAFELAWRNYLNFVFHPSLLRMTLATDTRFDSILFGCVLAVWMNPVRDRVPGTPRVWAGITALSIALLLITTAFGPEYYRRVWRPTVEGALLFPLFIAAIRFPHWPIFSWLNNRVVRHIGLLSYTLYLFHTIVLETFNVRWAVPQVVRGVTALAISVAFAETSYRIIERPAAAMRKRLHQRFLQPRSTALTSATTTAPSTA